MLLQKPRGGAGRWSVGGTSLVTAGVLTGGWGLVNGRLFLLIFIFIFIAGVLLSFLSTGVTSELARRR
jgi:hypothetical protein